MDNWYDITLNTLSGAQLDSFLQIKAMPAPTKELLHQQILTVSCALEGMNLVSANTVILSVARQLHPSECHKLWLERYPNRKPRTVEDIINLRRVVSGKGDS